MGNRIAIVATVCITLALITTVETTAKLNGGGDVLNEVPIWPVPAEMTLAEYRDANRRLNVGLVLISVPIPGALHFYADEGREGWLHVGAAALGLTSVILGAALIDEKDNAWENSDFETFDVVGEGGNVERYEKIPIEEEGGIVTHRLKQLDHKVANEGAGAAFIVLGAGLVVGQLLHDWIDGIKTIERKRDAVRFKYGKTAGYKLSLNPAVNLQRRSLGAQLAVGF